MRPRDDEDRPIEDAPVEWRAEDDESHGARMFWVITGVFGLPVIALLIGGAATFGLGRVLIGALVSAAVVLGILDRWEEQRMGVSIAPAGPDEFVVRQFNGGVVRYSFASVSRIRVTRYLGDHETLSMRISVGDKTVRTRSGLAETAVTFLAMCTEAGAEVTYKTDTSD